MHALNLKSFLQNIVPFLKERPRGVEAGDPGEVLHLLADKPGDVGAEAEADQVGVVVDGDTHILVDCPNESRNLK